jgi:hypothetical protein
MFSSDMANFILDPDRTTVMITFVIASLTQQKYLVNFLHNLFQIKKGLPIILYQIYSLRPQHNVED